MRLLQQFVVTLRTDDVLNANGGRGHHFAHAGTVKRIIEQVRPRASRLEPMDEAFVMIAVYKATKRRYDAQNLQETAKPIVDAVVRAGKLTDDDNEHVIGPLMVHAGVDRSLSKKANPYLGERVKFRVMFFDPTGMRETIAAWI